MKNKTEIKHPKVTKMELLVSLREVRSALQFMSMLMVMIGLITVICMVTSIVAVNKPPVIVRRDSLSNDPKPLVLPTGRADLGRRFNSGKSNYVFQKNDSTAVYITGVLWKNNIIGDKIDLFLTDSSTAYIYFGDKQYAVRLRTDSIKVKKEKICIQYNSKH